jgi:uncharacterized protein YdeI (YjbR/CyaY-like superfamily)
LFLWVFDEKAVTYYLTNDSLYISKLTQSLMAKTVEEYLENHSQQQSTLEVLRDILLKTELEETIKWGAPVYTLAGKHVIGLGAFKSYVGLCFFQGVFLQDQAKVLVNAQEGKTKALRQWRFESSHDLDKGLIKEYIAEAIQNQQEGKELLPDKTKPLVIPPELQEALHTNSSLAGAFEQLNLTKKREFAEYIAEAKRPATKVKRLAKISPMILEGVGLNDKYKK